MHSEPVFRKVGFKAVAKVRNYLLKNLTNCSRKLSKRNDHFSLVTFQCNQLTLTSITMSRLMFIS